MGCTRSAAAQCVHDFHHVTVAQDMGGVQAAGDDGAIDFHRHATLQQLLVLQQVEKGGLVGQAARFAVELDIHGAIVAEASGQGSPWASRQTATAAGPGAAAILSCGGAA